MTQTIFTYPLVGLYEGFEIGRFSKGGTIRILWDLGFFFK